MRTLARAVTYSLFALIVGASLSITWTTGLFWWVMFACAAAGLGILVGQWVIASREDMDEPEDERLTHDVARYHCAAPGCYMQVTECDDDGTTWTCATCKRPSWVPRADIVFDQQQEESA